MKTDPTSGTPPQPSQDTISAISKAAASDPLKQHVGGLDGGDPELGTKVKSEKECMIPRGEIQFHGPSIDFRFNED